MVEELQAADPLRALPEIALGDDEPQWVAVLGLERLENLIGLLERELLLLGRRLRYFSPDPATIGGTRRS